MFEDYYRFPKIDENSGVRWINIEDIEKVVNEEWVLENIYKKLNDKLRKMDYDIK